MERLIAALLPRSHQSLRLSISLPDLEQQLCDRKALSTPVRPMARRLTSSSKLSWRKHRPLSTSLLPPATKTPLETINLASR
eukprot:3479208-Pleurochrysis_carterae.AAC.1